MYVRKWYYTINACCTILWNRKRSTEQTCVFFIQVYSTSVRNESNNNAQC